MQCSGLHENERVNELAKDAAGKVRTQKQNFHCDAMFKIKECIIDDLRQIYTRTPTQEQEQGCSSEI